MMYTFQSNIPCKPSWKTEFNVNNFQLAPLITLTSQTGGFAIYECSGASELFDNPKCISDFASEAGDRRVEVRHVGREQVGADLRQRNYELNHECCNDGFKSYDDFGIRDYVLHQISPVVTWELWDISTRLKAV